MVSVCCSLISCLILKTSLSNRVIIRRLQVLRGRLSVSLTESVI